MMEPIYEARTAGGDGPRWIYRTADGTHVFDESMPRSMAAHIVRLLNADPLPEDRPKRYLTHLYAGTWYVRDTTQPGGYQFIASFTAHHPGAYAAAEDECGRLNAEASNVPS